MSIPLQRGVQGGEGHERDRRIWRLLAREIATAPPGARRSLRYALTGLVLAVLFILGDLVTGSSTEEAYRLLSLSLAVVGFFVLIVANGLFAATQSPARPGTSSILLYRPQVLHRTLVVLPTLFGAAAVFLAAAAGVTLPLLRGSPWLIPALATFVIYIAATARAALAVSDFLYHHAQAQAEAAARARAEAAESQLAALQAQLNPHFLFNALNTVAALVRRDARAAEATVVNLAEVLRRTLERTRISFGTVGEELEYLRAYLEVERQRWRERLCVEWVIGPDVEPLPLPPLTVQPLVENALKHGLGRRARGGTLRISITREADMLLIRVADDGEGFPPRPREGTGLTNVRQRLATLYGDRASLEIDSTPEGAVVSLRLPVERIAE